MIGLIGGLLLIALVLGALGIAVTQVFLIALPISLVGGALLIAGARRLPEG